MTEILKNVGVTLFGIAVLILGLGVIVLFARWIFFIGVTFALLWVGWILGSALLGRI